MYDILKGTKKDKAGRDGVVMLKKIFVLFFAIVLLQNLCFAGYFSETWRKYQNDPNYVHCSAKIGSEYYLDCSSVEIELDDSPEYIVSVEIAEVTREGVFMHTKIFYYNDDDEEMYLTNRDRSRWYYCANAPQWEDHARFSRAGDIAFYLAFGRSFYADTETITSLVDGQDS